MLISCLLGSASGLGLGLRYRFYVLILAHLVIMGVGTAVLIGGDAPFYCIGLDCLAGAINLQVGYIVTAFWCLPQRPPLQAMNETV